MKVALIAHLSEISGAGVALLGKAKGLDKRRFEAVLVLPGAGPLHNRAISEGIQPVIVPNKEVSIRGSGLAGGLRVVADRLGYIRQLARYLKTGKFDVAYINSTTSIFAGMAARLAGIPIIWQSHEMIVNPSRATRLKLGFIRKVSSAIVYDGQSAYDTFPPVSDIPWCITRNFTDVEALRQRAATLRVPADPALEPYRVLANGLFYRKGADLLLDAAEAAIIKHPELHFQVVLAGSEAGQDPDYIASLKSRALEGPLAGRVVFHGPAPDLVDVMLQCHVFVSPSRNEACPLSLVEALALGLPVISTDTGQCSRLLANGEGGTVVPCEDVDALSGALAEIILNYPAAMERAAAGQKHILGLYNKEGFFSDIETIMEKVSAQKIPSAS